MRLFLLAALPRLAYLLFARPAFTGPYWDAGIERPEFEPIYPLFLAAARVIARDQVIGVQLLQIAVSSVGTIFLYRLALSLTASSRIAILSAVLYAGDLLLIKQSVGQSPSVLVTTLLIAFTCAFVTAKITGRLIGAGLLLGLLVLSRTMTVPLVVIVAIILMRDGRARAALAATLAALVLIVPWSLRSYGANGSWSPTRSGLNLFISSLPAAQELVPDYDVDLLVPFIDDVLAEDLRGPNDDSPETMREIDRVLTRRAIANFSADPLRTLEGRAQNLAHYFWPPIVPRYIKGPETRVVVDTNGAVAALNAVARPRVEIVAYTFSYTVVLAAAVAGAVSRRRFLRRSDAMLIGILATFALTHAVYFPATRYRAPVTFVLLFYAAVAFDRWWDALLRRRHASIKVSTATPA